MANRHSISIFRETENPKSAAAVRSTLTDVTNPAPSFFVILSERRLDTIVPPEIIIVIIPAYDTGSESSARITGHADPRSESGSPRLMNAR